MTGHQITLVAVSYQVYVLTGSTLAVGMLGLVQAVPLIVAGLYAGALADRFDRKLVMLASLGILDGAAAGEPPAPARGALAEPGARSVRPGRGAVGGRGGDRGGRAAPGLRQRPMTLRLWTAVIASTTTQS
jgi:MFS family permease